MNLDFNWNTMNGGENPFEEKKTWAVDTRFYTLKKDEKGNGVALIRFLPSEVHENGQMSTIKRVYKYNVRAKTTKKFIAEWSPNTIGLPDPIQERWAQLWNAGQKEEAKRYARSTRYLANIKVINDPANPENNGKIFLLDMSQTLCEKIKSIIQPSEQEISLGTKPKNLFDPLNGYSFKLVASVGANGFTEYNKSDALAEPSAAYNSVEEFIKDIKENGHPLSVWDKPDAYKSYEELKSMLENLEVSNEANAEAPAPSMESVQLAQITAPSQDTKVSPNNVSDNLDALLADLAK